MQGIDTSIDPSLPLDNRLRKSELHFLMSIFAKNLTTVHNTITLFSLSDTGGGRIASSVIVMQAGSVFEDIAGRVLKVGTSADPHYPAHVRPTRHFYPLSVAPNLNPGCDNTHTCHKQIRLEFACHEVLVSWLEHGVGAAVLVVQKRVLLMRATCKK